VRLLELAGLGTVVDDDTEIGQGLHGGFKIAAHLGADGRGRVVRLLDGDDTAVGPTGGGDGVERGGQVFETDVDLLGRRTPPAPKLLGLASASRTCRVRWSGCTVR